MSPNDRRYAKTHEWVKIVEDTATVGITEHAQDALGDITYVEMPKVGLNVEQAGDCAVIESVKVAGDLFSPLSGEIAEINGTLDKSPELVNRDPYNEGWIFKLKNFSSEQYEGLMSAEEYEAFIAQSE